MSAGKRARAENTAPLSRVEERRLAATVATIRGRWMHRSHVEMRNAAWFVRYSRVTGRGQDEMIGRLVFEVQRLFDRGEPLESIVPSLVDLFIRP